LVYAGFTRTFLMSVTDTAPVDGRFMPLMNEYFASMADVHRILGVLDEADDKHATADGKEKTVGASILRLARMVGHDAADLRNEEWRNVAAWFSEEQLRSIHDAAFRHNAVLPADAPIVAAGTGRWQIQRLAARLQRPYVDLAALIPLTNLFATRPATLLPPPRLHCSTTAALEILPQQHRVVVLRLMGRVEQGQDVTVAEPSEQGINRHAIGIEFGNIALTETQPFRWIVCEPFAQFRTRRDLFRPEVDMSVLLGKATWPEPVHQHAEAVFIEGAS
jgi:hypothetical protein